MIVKTSSNSSWINVAVIGPHQHGKSTLAGFLLYGLHQLPAIRMNEAEQAAVKRNDPGRKFAFLLDRKAHERKIIAGVCRGTRETSWWTLERNGRHHAFSNTPGCPLCSTSLPATLSSADAAVLVVDTDTFLDSMEQKQKMPEKQILEPLAQIYTCLSLARFYGVHQLIIALHKMDTINFSKESCLTAKMHLERIVEELGWKSGDVHFVPTAVTTTEEKGHNIIKPDPIFHEWFSHVSLLGTIEQLHPRSLPEHAQFRMQLNSVNERGPVHIRGYQISITGKIVAGIVRLDDELLIQPSGMRCKVKTIQNIDNFRHPASTNLRHQRKLAIAGELVNLLCTITDGDIKVNKGEIAGTTTSSPPVSQRLRAELTPLATLPLSDLFAKNLSGTFVMGHFHSRFSLKNVSFDKGLTWVNQKYQAMSQKRALLLDTITQSHGGDPILGELHLRKKAPLETYAENSYLGRFVLFGSNSIPMFAGRIIEIL